MKLSFLKVVDVVRNFANWWGKELQDLVPRSVKSWVAEDIVQVLVEVDGDQARLYLCGANEREELGQSALLPNCLFRKNCINRSNPHDLPHVLGSLLYFKRRILITYWI